MPLKKLRNFWRSLEMPLINYKVQLFLAWIDNCGLTTDEIGANTNVTGAKSATFKIKDAELYVPVATLLTDDNVKLQKKKKKKLSERFKIYVYWNKYKVILDKNEVGANNNPKHIREWLDSSFDRV